MTPAAGTRQRSLFLPWLLAVLVLAAVLRVAGLRDLPPGLFCDEAALGYNSYSLLKTGRDETGTRWPLFVWSFGVSYKNPVFIYSGMLPVALFGLDEASVRLTAALWGVLGVLAAGLLGRRLFGDAGGIAAAAILAVQPWHLHFSRIAFELITLAPLVLWGTARFLDGVRGRPAALISAAVWYGLSLYAYAPARLFVPLLVAFSAAIHGRRLWAERRWTAVAVVTGLLVTMPLLIHDARHRERATQYFRNTTVLDAGRPWSENARVVWNQFRQFYSADFLFRRGDPLARHAVPQFGELQKWTAPLLVLGALWALWPRNPAGKMLLWWLATWPLAPSLMNEAPSASRGFIGSPVFALLAAAGLTVLWRGARLLRPPWAATAAAGALVVAAMSMMWAELIPYWRAYSGPYRAYAARAFQYGYREAIGFLQEHRDEADLLLVTANDVNQPQIFIAFYARSDPRLWQRGLGEPKYLVLHPAEFDRYHTDQRVLGAVRVADLQYFAEYRERGRVMRPDGGVEYVLAELRRRHRFARDWLLAGPFFAGSADRGVRTDFVPPDEADRAAGAVRWEPQHPQFVWVNLRRHYEQRLAEQGRSPDGACAYAWLAAMLPEEADARLQVSGSPDPMRIRIGRAPVRPGVFVPGPEPRTIAMRVKLRAGANPVVVQTCNRDGDWWFQLLLLRADGTPLPDLRWESDPRVVAPAPPTDQAARSSN